MTKKITIYEATGKYEGTENGLLFLHEEETDSLVEGIRGYLTKELNDPNAIEKVLETARFEGNYFLKITYGGKQILACDGDIIR